MKTPFVAFLLLSLFASPARADALNPSWIADQVVQLPDGGVNLLGPKVLIGESYQRIGKTSERTAVCKSLGFRYYQVNSISLATETCPTCANEYAETGAFIDLDGARQVKQVGFTKFRNFVAAITCTNDRNLGAPTYTDYENLFDAGNGAFRITRPRIYVNETYLPAIRGSKLLNFCRALGFRAYKFDSARYEAHCPTCSNEYLQQGAQFTDELKPEPIAQGITREPNVITEITCGNRIDSPTFTDSVTLENIESVLTTVGAQSYRQRTEFLNGIASAVSSNLPLASKAFDTVPSRLFVLIALDPFMRGLDSKWVREHFAPIWDRDLKLLQGNAGVAGIRDIPPSPNVARNAVAILHAGFAASKDFLTLPAHEKALGQIQIALGAAAASTMRPNAPQLGALLTLLKSQQPLLETLQSNPRSAAIGHSIGAVIEYLDLNYSR